MPNGKIERGLYNMNNCVFIGRIVKEPEFKFLPKSGTPFVKFRIAVERTRKIEGQPTADFFPVLLWGSSAEALANYVGKGNLIAVNGRIENRPYVKEKDTRYITEIKAREVKFLEYADRPIIKNDEVDEPSDINQG